MVTVELLTATWQTFVESEMVAASANAGFVGLRASGAKAKEAIAKSNPAFERLFFGVEKMCRFFIRILRVQNRQLHRQ
jgi:hypothetical protein